MGNDLVPCFSSAGLLSELKPDCNFQILADEGFFLLASLRFYELGEHSIVALGIDDSNLKKSNYGLPWNLSF